jgi:CheY-like chemotaxis protein
VKKILVIEDEEFILEAILEILEAEDFQAIAAENGAIGVQVAREHIPDLIICDILMPEMNGREVLTQLRSDPVTANIPFIFITAQADSDSVRKGMELGADEYVTKPFTHEELLHAVSRRLSRLSLPQG